ncbi:putative PIF1 helicase-like protein [Trypanosoma theileri]|uniref:ATP-dependent DNA helicase n=1 Tax=Trypanosoma theileri TaxID=67003 RepID=A0A1X0NSB2_9TRYP|nr:putative PIF1 helicase-like protein [Trypanosoma theileri]ORC87010.1 putative PIF1 helicase-like protein [Trypanosoma theileri]
MLRRIRGITAVLPTSTNWFAQRGQMEEKVQTNVIISSEEMKEKKICDHVEVSPSLQGPSIVSSVSHDAFINPFTGRLTTMKSRVSKELLRVGFVRSPVNPFRLTWDASKLPILTQTALKPFLNSMVSWRKRLAELLLRGDAADAIAEEIHRLYGELTSAYLPPKLDAMHDPQLSGMTMTPDQENVIRFALRGYSMFIGGSAGTGKTVLLKAIHRRLTEMGLRVAMTATTGVASVQLGGCTFHLAFGVPVGNEPRGRRRWDVNALRAVDVVIIDEVSLLDAELFDAFDAEARMARMRPQPFGGLQVIACGDFLQLAHASTTGSCCGSAAFQQLLAVRLVTPMRHTRGDALYTLLSQLRLGKFDARAFAALDRPLPEKEEEVTYIFPRRRDAQRLNDTKLCELQSEEMMFAPQRGPLHLVGSFTPAGLLEFSKNKKKKNILTPNREEIVQVVQEELKNLTGVDVVDHNIVVMPANGEKHALLLRLRNPEDTTLIRKGSNTNSNSSNSNNNLNNTITINSNTSNSAVLSSTRWTTVLNTVAERLNATLRHVYNEDPQGFIPLSVSMALADASNHPNAEQLTPLRLKLGCRVMVNRNLSRTVSNGSVGVVEAFAPPNPDLFPRRHETPARTVYGRLLEKNMFPKLPIVRLLSGEVVQIPPLALMLGGTPSTFFYGHEIYALPLQLGYGFTVHKVQGLTLQGTVVLDCKNFFECPHLVYVACSRVRSMDQLIVRNIRSDMIIVKQSALEFSNQLKDASLITNFIPPEGFARASWVERQTTRLLALNE